jgi:hypothetical protein
MIPFFRFQKSIILNIGLFLFCTLLLLWSALSNGYPLVHSDTGAYVESSFTLKVPLNDRPIGYGLFLTTGQLFNTLWLPVFLQSLITAFLLFRVASLILPETKKHNIIAFIAIIITVITSDVSHYVSWIMADIFTSWLFLGTLIFFISTRFLDKFFSVFIVVSSFTAHNSHVYLLFLSTIFLLFVSWKFHLKNNLFWKNSKKFALIVLLATIGVCTSNLISGNGFTLTNNNSIFYISKLSYHSVLTRTLDRYCSEKKWKLCDYREIIALKGNERFPYWYLWESSSPLQKMGGWKNNPENEKEYKDIIFHSLKSFFPIILLSSVRETFKHLTTFSKSSELEKYNENYAVIRSLQCHYPDEYLQFMSGKQQSGEVVKTIILPFDKRITQLFLVVVALIVLGYCIWGKHYFLFGILLSFFIFIFLNALVIGFTVNTEERYQGRILWLISYFIFLVISALILKHRKNPQPDMQSPNSIESKLQDNKLQIS